MKLEPQAPDPFKALHLILVLLLSFLNESPQIAYTSDHANLDLLLGRKSTLFPQELMA